MYVISDVLKSIDALIEKYEDPRSTEWLGMSSPYPTIALIIVYVISIKIGIIIMEKRKPVVLNNVLVAYNALQVMLSTYLFYNLSIHGWMRTGKLLCDPLNFSADPSTLALACAGWWYYFAKFTEFFDTYFFIVRKKNKQISSLHVTHHSIMPLVAWCGAKFSNGGAGSHYGMLNSFVHVIMYTYYLLAAMGPKYQKYIWWKKYLTIVQLTQFVLIFFHATILLFIDCPVNKLFSYIVISSVALFFIKFKFFYQETYTKQESKLLSTDTSENKVQSNSEKKNF